jgi:hypothetical protein
VTPGHRVILIEPLAPAKPVPGSPCNGCGVCCLSEPCPVGILLSRKLSGRCHALRWDAQGSHYRCGLLRDGKGWLARLARRWISAGSGCDAPDEILARATDRAG